jgi:hypothetical protein
VEEQGSVAVREPHDLDAVCPSCQVRLSEMPGQGLDISSCVTCGYKLTPEEIVAARESFRMAHRERVRRSEHLYEIRYWVEEKTRRGVNASHWEVAGFAEGELSAQLIAVALKKAYGWKTEVWTLASRGSSPDGSGQSSGSDQRCEYQDAKMKPVLEYARYLGGEARKHG